ncbi:MAG TPA: hypothetical protein VGI39_04435 [Polyangiaceae bacterium]|jgi:hypothetical protein
MSARNEPNKTTAQVLNQKALEGIDKYFAKTKSLVVNGTSYTPSGLKEVLQAENDTSKAVDSTRAQLNEEVASYRTAKAAAFALRTALRDYITMHYGKEALKMLGDFGMAPKKSTGVKSAQVKANAVTKANATRKARDTKSVDQKTSLSGVSEQPAAAVSPKQGAPAATPAPSTAPS